MKSLDFIVNNQSVLFPRFYTVHDEEGNEFIFLQTDDSFVSNLKIVKDKTQLEAYENHVHICGKVKEKNQKQMKYVASLIAGNLCRLLKLNFPDKKFIVYLDCDFSDHVIIRFHQLWKDEPLYYDSQKFKTIEEFRVGF